MTNRFPLPIGVLLTGVLLSSCSHSPATTDTAAGSTAPAAAAGRTTGTRVDSLNGIPGHHFGEPLSAFPGLKEGETNIEGMKRYYYPYGQTNQGSGWFGKHAQQLRTSYYFFDNKFAYFMAIAYNDNRQILTQEVTYLLGTGDQFQLTGTIWQGKQARAIYTDHPTVEGPMQQLEVASESLEAQQKQRAAARLKAENEVR